MTKPEMTRLTDAEEARIQMEIAADLDSPELTDEQIAAGGSARDMLSPDLFAALTRRGRPKSETAKRLVTLRLDPVVLDGYRQSGPGWQVRMGEVLAAGLKSGRPDVDVTPRAVGPFPEKGREAEGSVPEEGRSAAKLSAGGTPLRKLYPKSRRPA